MLNQRVKSDPVVGLRYRGLSPSMPSVSRFRSGYVPSGVTANLSESDMDTCSDSDGECYGARYSPEASPQELPNGSAKYGGYLYDESSPLSELSSTPPRRQNGAILKKKLKNKIDHDIPSAPPLSGSSPVDRVSERLWSSGADAKPSLRTSGGSSTKVEPNMNKSTNFGAIEVNSAEASVRAAAVPSHSLPAIYPTFHASGLGYWYSVLAYDACVRLCLHSWAKGCMEAPTFLENECALLRNAFGLVHILLQSEEELLKKEKTELVSEGASVKTKKTIGKIKIQE